MEGNVKLKAQEKAGKALARSAQRGKSLFILDFRWYAAALTVHASVHHQGARPGKGAIKGHAKKELYARLEGQLQVEGLSIGARTLIGRSSINKAQGTRALAIPRPQRIFDLQLPLGSSGSSSWVFGNPAQGTVSSGTGRPWLVRRLPG